MRRTNRAWGARRIGRVAAGACAVLALFGCEKNIKEHQIKPIALTEIRGLMQENGSSGIVLIDPRAPRDFDAGHLPGARNVRLPDVPVDSEVDPNLTRYRSIVVYGNDPGSPVARAMTKRMMAVGYRGVRWYTGGTKEWVESGLELESDSGVEGSPEPAEVGAGVGPESSTTETDRTEPPGAPDR